MHTALNYIRFCLKTCYIDYPNQLASINSYLSPAIEQTLFDTNAKYQGKLRLNSWEGLLPLLQTEPTIEAVFFYRLERLIFLDNPDNPLLPYLASVMRRRTGSEIYYSTEIGKGFNIQHGFGIVIGPRFKIGDNFVIHQGVTLGQKNTNSPNETITIGNNVTIFANASILGDITIGDNAKIGANSVLLKSVESDAVYAGAPAKRISMK
ncbi:serine O-acetyltransferase [Alteromonas sp. S015]|uniref:serine O-acetyltransferase n=1 Tax=Alteromonas sp. S015 TaxID=3117401 RepID=UPI002FE2F99C